MQLTFYLKHCVEQWSPYQNSNGIIQEHRINKYDICTNKNNTGLGPEHGQ